MKENFMSGIDEGVLGTCLAAVAPSSGVPRKGRGRSGRRTRTLLCTLDVSEVQVTIVEEFYTLPAGAKSRDSVPTYPGTR
jgi:hypothetical protein